MFSTAHHKSTVVPLNHNPFERLMYAVAARAALDVLRADTPRKHRRTARQFIAENVDLFLSAGIPKEKVQMLLNQSGSGAATPDPVGASR